MKVTEIQTYSIDYLENRSANYRLFFEFFVNFSKFKEVDFCIYGMQSQREGKEHNYSPYPGAYHHFAYYFG